MPAKMICYDADARARLLVGVRKLARAVKSTLGPKGRTVALDKGWGSPTLTKDGVSVAEDIDLTDRFENLGAQLLKEASKKTSDVAGDGTTTATVLAEAIFSEGLKAQSSGANPMAVAAGLQSACDAVEAALKAQGHSVQGRGDIEHVARIASNGDAEVGKMLAEAMEKAGKDGVITVEEGRGLKMELDVVEGMEFDRGFISPNFVTNPDRMEAILENALVLIHEDKISNLRAFVPFLEKVLAEGKPLLVIAEDVESDALATLVVNRLKGTLACAAVKAPGYGDRRKAILEDIAILTGGKVLYKDLGESLEKWPLKNLGRARKIIVAAERTVLVKGAGVASDLQARIGQIRREIEDTDSDYDREKLQERLAKLAGGVAQIRVGAASEVELKERKARVEDALHATRAAVEEGVVPGGGVALLRAEAALDALKEPGDRAIGVRILKIALSAPLRQIAENAGKRGPLVAEKVRAGKGAFGYNAQTDVFEDLVAAGVIDPLKVVRLALRNAVSVAAMLLTADALVVERSREDSEGEGPPEGGPGHDFGGAGGDFGGGDMNMDF